MNWTVLPSEAVVGEAVTEMPGGRLRVRAATVEERVSAKPVGPVRKTAKMITRSAGKSRSEHAQHLSLGDLAIITIKQAACALSQRTALSHERKFRESQAILVEAMWRMLQQDKRDDYAIATGETHSIREFLELSFAHAGLEWQKYVEIIPKYYRPAEVDLLIGDAPRINLRDGIRTVYEWYKENSSAAQR